MKWVCSMMPEKQEGLTIAVDGKTICSTGKMYNYESLLHIISAQVSELGMTFAQKCTNSKSNEIPAVQEFLEELDIRGCLVIADALNCQKKTATAVTAGKGNYLLCAKDNQETLKKDIDWLACRKE